MIVKIVGDTAVPGFYAVRLVKGGPLVPIHICEIDGDLFVARSGWIPRGIDLAEVWPRCAKQPISATEFEIMCKRAGLHDPRRPINMRTLPPVRP